MKTLSPNALSRLIRPKSIAVFGGKEAGRVIEQCDKMGYQGEIWPVHPTKDTVHGHKCYRSVADLPAAPDAAFVGVNRLLTIDIMRALSERGAGGAICYASGFSEAIRELPDGDELQAKLVEAAGDMAVVGPNCYGFINMLDGALLWPDQHGMIRTEKGVAILTQSSNIACNISMQARGLPLAYLMTAGNQAQTGLSALAVAALEDPRVTAIGLHIEGFDDLETLEWLGNRARALKKPVIALKVGKSDAAQKATVSHTASLAGNDKVSSAVLARLGIGRVDTLPELIETLKLLHVAGPLETNEISSMSCSGGEASLIADAGVGRNVNFRELKDEQRAPLRDILGQMVTISNPLDYHTFVWGNLEKQTAAFATMMRGGYALNLIILDFPRIDRCDPADWTTTVDAVISARHKTGANAGVVASLGENMPEDVAFRLVSEGVVPFSGFEEALAAVEAAHAIHQIWAGPEPAPLLKVTAKAGDGVTLTEFQSKAMLKDFGLSVPNGRLVSSADGAVEAAATIGFPVALKGSGIAHKTEAGAVRLGLSTPEGVQTAFAEMREIAEEFLVEKMAGKPIVELIIGALRDPVAGPVLTIGAGGILVELIDDSAIITLPTTKAEIECAISGLKVSKLLAGYRGQKKGDLPALVGAISAAADFVIAHAETLEELDINPLMVMAEGEGVMAADALVKIRRPK
jgi:acyl-CoA synthetase (NDP forming)